MPSYIIALGFFIPVIIFLAISLFHHQIASKKFKQLKAKYEGKYVTFTGFGWVIFKVVELRKDDEGDMEILVYNKEADEHVVLFFDEKNIKIKE